MRRPQTNRAPRAVPQALIDALLDDWDARGAAAIERLRKWSPERYVRLVASLAPAGLPSEADEVAAMSDEAIIEEIIAIRKRLSEAGAMPDALRTRYIEDV